MKKTYKRLIAFVLFLTMTGSLMGYAPEVKALNLSDDAKSILDLLTTTQATGTENATTQNSVVNALKSIPTTKVTNLAITGTTVDSIGLSWTAASDADWYVISYWPTGSASAATTLTNVGNVTAYTISGLTQNEYVIYVMPAKKLDNGELAYGRAVNYTTIKCAPTAQIPSGFSLANVGTGYCSFTVSGLGASDTSFYDSEVMLFDYSGKELGTYTGQPCSVSISDSRIKKNRFYSAKIRGFYKMTNGTKVYGAWSKRIYFATSIKKVSGSAIGKKISLNWSQVKGASNYSVYVKISSADSYSKVKTTKKTSYNVTKYRKKALKSGRTYYIKIVANKKKGGTTYKCKSDKYKVTLD